jgi:hypothetical protein
VACAALCQGLAFVVPGASGQDAGWGMRRGGSMRANMEQRRTRPSGTTRPAWLIARSSYSIRRLTGAGPADGVPRRAARMRSGRQRPAPSTRASPRCPRRPQAGGGGPQEVGHRHHNCGLAAQVDHLIRSGIRAGRGWLGGHRLPPLIMRSRSSTAGRLSLTFANVQSSSRAIVSPARARSRPCIACS